jgi:hypothetical protein
MKDQTPERAHWSKDFVEHLRTVHFALMAVCFGLLVLGSFPSPSQVSRADEEIKQIQAVANGWNMDFLEQAAATVAAKNLPAPETLPYPFRSSDVNGYLITGQGVRVRNIPYKIYFPYPTWLIEGKVPAELSQRGAFMIKGTFVPESNLKIIPPRNIALFQELWDNLLQPVVIDYPSGPPSSCRYGPGFDSSGRAIPPSKRPKCELRSDMPEKYWERLQVEYTFANGDDPNNTDGFPFASTEFHALLEFHNDQGQVTDSGDHFLAPSEIGHVTFDAHRILTAMHPAWVDSWRLPFDQAFRDLAAVDGPFKNVDLASAENILGAESERSGEAFEALGMKVPAEVAVRFGVLLVVGIQLYMWIHLHEFGNRVDKQAGFEVAWIGVYFSRAARIIFYLTVFLLPECTIMFLSLRGLHSTQNKGIAWSILVASNLASLVMSYMIFRVLPEPEKHTHHAAPHAGAQSE